MSRRADSFFIAVLLQMTAIRAFSQDTTVILSQDEAVHMALANNKNVRMADIDEKTAAARYKETQAIFLPQAGISYTAMTTDNPLNAFGFKLQQATIGQADFAPATLNHPGSASNFLTSVDLRQPIVNLDALFQRRSAAAVIDIYRFRAQFTREGLVFQVRQAYMQLQLATEAVHVLSSSLAAADSLRLYIKDRVGEGMLSKADELNAEVQVAAIRSKLEVAHSAVQNSSDALGLLMGTPSAQSYRGLPQLQTIENSPVTVRIVPAERADLAALRKAAEAAGLAIRSTQMSALPRLNAFGSYQFNDYRMLGFGAHSYVAGIQLSWDIFKGNSIRNKIATQRLELSRLQTELSREKEQSDADLRKAMRSLGDAGYAVRQANTAVDAAKESYRILLDRYQQGLAGNTDVLLAQDQLQRQQLSLAQAIFEHNVATAYIDLLTAGSDTTNH